MQFAVLFTKRGFNSRTSHANIDVRERFLHTAITGSYRRINSVANSSHCRNSGKPLGRRGHVWHETRADVYNCVFGKAVGPCHRH